MLDIVYFVALGAFSGFMAGLLGIGGGLIMTPVLLYLLAADVSQNTLMHTAIGTSLACIVFTSISSVRAHNKHGAISWKNFKKLTPTILVGAFSGAIVAKHMSFDFLRIVFIVFEIIMAIQLWFNFKTSSYVDNITRPIWLLTGAIIGFISAIVGIGGGVLTTPFLVYNNVDIKKAIATSSAIGLPIAIAGSIGFIIAGWDVGNTSNLVGFLHLEALFFIVLFSVICAPFGANLAHRVDGVKLKKFFALFLFCLAFSVIVY